ncbi:substrate-binding domain-containing protein [Ruegeria lacuscaerulensis]|uniref:substrate-binding domain-containing protein n=1 Tax=Ruegeria lacuscaerulensis TaxID=55218 RepID=UPI00147C296E|nr:substrate-binding domain-containing protein [Ruegeria lacuscaerulensis]
MPPLDLLDIRASAFIGTPQINVTTPFSLIGFDDIPSAAWPRHMLTTIRQLIRRMIREAVSLLIERMENPDLKPKVSNFPGTLILRNSTRRTGPSQSEFDV